MSWELVALTLGLSAIASAVYVARLTLMAPDFEREMRALREMVSDRARAEEALAKRVATVEAALRIDGAAVMARANKNALPGFMK